MNSISQRAQEEEKESEDDIEAEFGNATTVRTEAVFVFLFALFALFSCRKSLALWFLYATALFYEFQHDKFEVLG